MLIARLGVLPKRAVGDAAIRHRPRLDRRTAGYRIRKCGKRRVGTADMTYKRPYCEAVRQVARTNEAVLAGERPGRGRRPGEAGPVPLVLGCANLRCRCGNGGRRARRRRGARPGAGSGRKGRSSGSQINRSDLGGARLGCAGSMDSASRPRCTRIRSMTAGASMLAMTRSRPPHCRQVSMSMANTRLRRCA